MACATLSRLPLQRCLKELEHGDKLTVGKLDRLGRSVLDVVNTVHDLSSRGVKFQSLPEQIDTTHPLRKAMLPMGALLGGAGARVMVECTKTGQQAARPRVVSPEPNRNFPQLKLPTPASSSSKTIIIRRGCHLAECSGVTQ